MRTKSAIRLTALTLALLAAAGASVAAGETAVATPAGELDRLVSSLEGGWFGDDNDTPFGKMPFVALFEWEEDGSLHAFSPLNRETYIDLRFARDEAGRWMLHEEAAMEGGVGVQRYSLAPAGRSGDEGLYRWVSEEDPSYLTIDLGLVEETLLMEVILRQRPHVAFRLERQPREAWAEMKRQLQAQGALSPEEGTSILEAVSDPPVSLGGPPAPGGAPAALDPIAEARQAVEAEPASAPARLELARRIGAAINADPANGPRYAFEMRAALEKAIELDPHLGEAYHWLVGYYLNAPPIAGGSTEKAEETARRLAEFDPDGAAPLLARIAARRDAAGPGS